MVSPPLHGIFFVFSLPGGEARDTKNAKPIVANILKKAFWNLEKRGGVCAYQQFSDQEVSKIAEKTTHLTKYHVNMFGWDKMERSNTELLQVANALCTEREDAETIKDKLPMFRGLPDSTIDCLVRGGRLPAVLSRFLEPAADPELPDCEHTFECHGGGDCSCGREVAFKCIACDATKCYKCHAAYKAKLYEEQDMKELIDAMESGWQAEQVRAIAAEAEEESFDAEPDSPAAVRFAEQLWIEAEENKTQQARREAESLECDAKVEEERQKARPGYCGSTHPFMYGGVEVSEMKKQSVIEQAGLMKMELRDRNIKLLRGDFSTVPQFLDVFQELFGSSFSGRKASENLIQSARHIYNMITGVQIPETSKLDLSIREHIERMISGDPSITRCRSCQKKFKSRSREVVCSEACRTKHTATNAGLVCKVCASAIVKRRNHSRLWFFNPSARYWHGIDMLEMSREAITASFPEHPEYAAFVLETQRKRDPIMFCSRDCERSWMETLICQSCGGADGSKEAFPRAIRPRERVDGRLRWNLQSMQEDHMLTTKCRDCSGFMAPRLRSRCEMAAPPRLCCA